MDFFEKSKKNIVYILQLLCSGILLGVVGGLLGTFFHMSIHFVTTLRENFPRIILLLPVGGVVIAVLYGLFQSKGNIDTKRVFQSVNEGKNVPVVMMPLIYAGTVITHLFGGSAGREGAALQLGGSLGYNMGLALKKDKEHIKLMVSAGMSSVFSAMFGTPFAAAFFSLEVTTLGLLNIKALFIGVVSSVVSFAFSNALGVTPVRFNIPMVSEYQISAILRVVILAVLCAVVCIVFATAIHKTEHLMKKYLSSPYIRVAAGGLIVVALTAITKTTDYNGAGMDVIEHAISGEAKTWAFLMKILFTSITIAAGFKGGEIVPTFFIGSTFGCVAGSLMGLDGAFCAALGLVAMFSGMTKCPVASIFLAIEVFGAQAVVFFIMVVVITYIFSGSFGLYDTKKWWESISYKLSERK